MLNNTILSQLLTPRHRAAGLALEEDDHSVILYRDTQSKYPDGEPYVSREVFAHFNVTRWSPTVMQLQEAADRVMDQEAQLPFSVEDFEKSYPARCDEGRQIAEMF